MKKTTADKVRELVAKGLWGAEIARELGISKQRVSQICLREGIDPRDGRRGPPPAPSTPITSRLATGGVILETSRRACGAISELLVAADLTARGWLVYLPLKWSRGFDLIAMKNERLLRVEVKSASRALDGKVCFTKATRHSPDVFAYVITGEPVIFDPPLEVDDERHQSFADPAMK